MALRYADRLKFGPWGYDEEFMSQLKEHFSDSEIAQIGYIVMAYGGAHAFLASIGERVFDDEGNDLDGVEGFPLVFSTKEGVTRYQTPEEAAPDGPLPPTPTS